MGMDVYGKSPTTETGKYFRASVWSWRPLHGLIAEVGSDLFDEETLKSMGYNDGAGLDSQEKCDELADRIESWLETNKGGITVEDSTVRVDENGCFIRNAVPTQGLSPYKIGDSHIKEFVKFLRGCGGFEVL